MGVKLKYATKSEMVYKELRKAIIDGEMKPGERYSIGEIAEKFGVSRSPVSEAVKLLETQDLVKILPNVGFEIRVLTKDEICEVLSIRGALEGLAIRKVIDNITVKELEILENIVKETVSSVKELDLEKYLQANEDFHFNLYKFSRSKKLYEVLRDYWMHEVWYVKDIWKISDRIQMLIDDHLEMLEIIREKRYEDIQKIIDQHVKHCVDIVVYNLKESGFLEG